MGQVLKCLLVALLFNIESGQVVVELVTLGCFDCLQGLKSCSLGFLVVLQPAIAVGQVVVNAGSSSIGRMGRQKFPVFPGSRGIAEFSKGGVAGLVLAEDAPV